MKQGGTVLVVGDVFNDIIVRPVGPAEEGTDTCARINILPGGSGANQAAWLAHFGCDVMFLGRVGAKDFAQHDAALRSCGVIPVLAQDPIHPTGNIISLIAPDGQRSFFTDRGANSHLQEDDFSPSLLEGVRHIHISAYSLFEASPRSVVLGFLAKAKQQSIPISVDPASVSCLRLAGVQAFLEWTELATLCFPNHEEAAVLSGTSDIDEQLDFLCEHFSSVVVKRGLLGAAAGRGKDRWTEPAPVIKALDTTGAGDAFVAAFLASSFSGAPMGQCMAAGVLAGTAATQVLGGRPASRVPFSGTDGISPKCE